MKNIRHEVVIVGGFVAAAAEYGASTLPAGTLHSVAVAAIPLLAALGIRPHVVPLSKLGVTPSRLSAALAALLGRQSASGPALILGTVVPEPVAPEPTVLPKTLSEPDPTDIVPALDPATLAALAAETELVAAPVPVPGLSPFVTATPEHAPQEQTA